MSLARRGVDGGRDMRRIAHRRKARIARTVEARQASRHTPRVSRFGVDGRRGDSSCAEPSIGQQRLRKALAHVPTQHGKPGRGYPRLVIASQVSRVMMPRRGCQRTDGLHGHGSDGRHAQQRIRVDRRGVARQGLDGRRVRAGQRWPTPGEAWQASRRPDSRVAASLRRSRHGRPGWPTPDSVASWFGTTKAARGMDGWQAREDTSRPLAAWMPLVLARQARRGDSSPGSVIARIGKDGRHRAPRCRQWSLVIARPAALTHRSTRQASPRVSRLSPGTAASDGSRYGDARDRRRA